MHNSSETCAGVKCEVIDEETCRESHKDMCCITIERIRKSRAGERKASLSLRKSSDICDAGVVCLHSAPHQRRDVMLNHLHTVHTRTSR